MGPKIFLSYSWSDKIEADQVDNYLSDSGYDIIRDIRENSYKRNIKEFMKTIGESDFVITLISDSFLRSSNCMYEILELTKNPDYKSRVLQIILPNANIFSPKDRGNYVLFWSNECKELEAMLDSNITDSAKEDIKRDYNVFKDIEKTIYEFTTFLSEEKGITLKSLKEENFQSITGYIGKRYQYERPINRNKAEIRSLDTFKIGQKFYGRIKLIYNYGFFIQVHSDTGFRDGLLHKNKLAALGYDFSKLKRFLKVGDEIHVEISDINFNTPAAKNTGGLGFIPTTEFQSMLQKKLSEYLKEVMKKNEEIVDLSGLCLTELPEEIKKMTSLKMLFLNGNKFNDMPNELESLPNLDIVFCDFIPKRDIIGFNYVIYQQDE